MNKYPMKLTPVPRQMIWGGNRLKTKYSKQAPFENIGESWELTCRPEAHSTVSNGEYAGLRLSNVIECDCDFPLLIKFIDAYDNLSVQVHPDDSIVDESGKTLGKTEMWYIIDALEDSYLIYGLKDNVSIEDFSNMVDNDTFESALKKVYVKPGDCFFIPAGQVHAIGKGILLAEVQQNSDTTYRIYDYGRIDKDGKPRELHIDSALKVVKNYTEQEIENLQFSKGKSESCLANCDKFSCFKYDICHDAPIAFSKSDGFTVLLFTGGTANILCDGKSYTAYGGDTFYIPEDISFEISGSTTLLKIESNKDR